jgi:hypothetical protein
MTISATQLDKTSHLEAGGTNSRQLRIASAALGNGLTGGGASTISLDTASSVTYSGASHSYPAGELLVTGTPANDNSVPNKAYVDAVAEGLRVKDSCRAIATTSKTKSGTQTIDDVSLVADDRVLLTAQDTASENGVWVVAAGAWSRPADFAAGGSASAAFCFIEEGTSYADSGWVCTTDSGSDTIDTHDLAWSQFSGAGQITAGDGIQKSGNTLNVDVSDFAGTGLEDDGSENLRIASSAAGDGLTGGSGSALAVDPDNSTVEISGGKVALKAAGVGSTQLASNAVTTAKITDANVTTAKIADANVTAGKLASDAVTTVKVADDAITAAKIAAGAVGSSELASDAVTPAKLGLKWECVDVLASAFAYDSTRSNKTLSSSALSDASIDSGVMLMKNGLDSMTKVTTTSGSDEWSLSGTTLSVHGDITASGDTYRLRYWIAHP